MNKDTSDVNKYLLDIFLSKRDDIHVIPEDIPMLEEFRKFKTILKEILIGKQGIDLSTIVERFFGIIQPREGELILGHAVVKNIVMQINEHIDKIIEAQGQEVLLRNSVSTTPCFPCQLFAQMVNVLMNKTTNLDHLKLELVFGNLTLPEENYLTLQEFEEQALEFFKALQEEKLFTKYYTELVEIRPKFKNFKKKQEMVNLVYLDAALLENKKKLKKLKKYYK